MQHRPRPPAPYFPPSEAALRRPGSTAARRLIARRRDRRLDRRDLSAAVFVALCGCDCLFAAVRLSAAVTMAWFAVGRTASP